MWVSFAFCLLWAPSRTEVLDLEAGRQEGRIAFHRCRLAEGGERGRQKEYPHPGYVSLFIYFYLRRGFFGEEAFRSSLSISIYMYPSIHPSLALTLSLSLSTRGWGAGRACFFRLLPTDALGREEVFWGGREEKKRKERAVPGFPFPIPIPIPFFLFSSPGRVLAIFLACPILYCIITIAIIEKGSIAGRAARTDPGLRACSLAT